MTAKENYHNGNTEDNWLATSPRLNREFPIFESPQNIMRKNLFERECVARASDIYSENKY
jgi:hypothetical protein